MSSYGRQRALEMFADWSDRIAGGRTPATTTAAPKVRSGTSCSRYGIGGTDDAFHSRRGGDRQTEPDGQCWWAGVRRFGGAWHACRRRSGRQLGDGAQDPGETGRPIDGADALPAAAAPALVLLGRRTTVGGRTAPASRSTQSDAGQQGAGLDDLGPSKHGTTLIGAGKGRTICLPRTSRWRGPGGRRPTTTRSVKRLS